jgi:hypothetical protein
MAFHVPIRDVGNSDFSPFHGVVTIFMRAGALFGQATLTTVPAGKRLVVEYLDGRAELPVGQRITLVRFAADVSPFQQIEHCFGAKFQATAQAPGGPVDCQTFNHLLRAYADPGTSIEVFVNRSDSTGTASARVNLTGYFVNL